MKCVMLATIILITGIAALLRALGISLITKMQTSILVQNLLGQAKSCTHFAAALDGLAKILHYYRFWNVPLEK